MKRKLFGSMTALAAVMLAFSCSDEITWPGGGPDVGIVDDGMAEVTFSVRTEGAVATRAKLDDPAGHGPGWNQNVGRGSEIDMLIYAVYETVETEENGVKETSYTLLSQYGQGIVNSDETEDSDAFKEFKEKSPALSMTDDAGETYQHLGQTIVYDPFDKEDGNNGVREITLRLVRGKEYTIAFWAQSSQSVAYVTDELEKVRVIYGTETETETDDNNNVTVEYYVGMLNNDETRDAFCKKETFTVGVNGATRDVILTRPLAQINVGTSGADFFHNAAEANPPREASRSSILLHGVAQQLNVVTDLVDESELVNVSFAYDVIPAYSFLGEIPSAAAGASSHFGKKYKYANDDEEFLYVDLNQDGEFKDYKETYPTRNEEGEALTETFKYLSMCYVLVPATPKTSDSQTGEGSGSPEQGVEQDDANGPVGYNAATLSYVKFKFTTEDRFGNAEVKEGKKHAFSPIELTNVPVQRNYRTNILGGLYWMRDSHDPNDPNTSHDPNDPNDPHDPNDSDDDDPYEPDYPDPDPEIPGSGDDPTTVFGGCTATVQCEPAYGGEHTGKDDGQGDWGHIK